MEKYMKRKVVVSVEVLSHNFLARTENQENLSQESRSQGQSEEYKINLQQNTLLFILIILSNLAYAWS
jgi:hypothetical protein